MSFTAIPMFGMGNSWPLLHSLAVLHQERVHRNHHKTHPKPGTALENEVWTTTDSTRARPEDNRPRSGNRHSRRKGKAPGSARYDTEAKARRARMMFSDNMFTDLPSNPMTRDTGIQRSLSDGLEETPVDDELRAGRAG